MIHWHFGCALYPLDHFPSHFVLSYFYSYEPSKIVDRNPRGACSVLDSCERVGLIALFRAIADPQPAIAIQKLQNMR